MTNLDFVITDDWELRGDGSGDMRIIQFNTARQFAAAFAEHGHKVSFNVEVLQQLRHLEYGASIPRLAALAEEWEEIVLDFYRQGHDIQLHIHSQWTDVDYLDDHWQLKGDWSILRHPENKAAAIIGEAKDYLEQLIHSVDPSYRCVAFRSGGWCLAPSPHMLTVLANLGIRVDISITKGLHYNQLVNLDYRDISEALEPFYPRIDDARHLANAPGPVICCPVVCYRQKWKDKLIEAVGKKLTRALNSRAQKAFVIPSSVPIPGAATNRYGGWGYQTQSEGGFGLLSRLKRFFTPRLITADISGMNFYQIKSLIAAVRKEAWRRGLTRLPVILAHHTKDMGDLNVAQGLSKLIANEPTMRVITLQELASNLDGNLYRVRYLEDGFGK